MSEHCYIGPLGLHTWNYERTECIWCGPGALAWKPGRWVSLGDGMSAWSADETQAARLAAQRPTPAPTEEDHRD